MKMDCISHEELYPMGRYEDRPHDKTNKKVQVVKSTGTTVRIN